MQRAAHTVALRQLAAATAKKAAENTEHECMMCGRHDARDARPSNKRYFHRVFVIRVKCNSFDFFLHVCFIIKRLASLKTLSTW
jgi:hypothetical protein